MTNPVLSGADNWTAFLCEYYPAGRRTRLALIRFAPDQATAESSFAQVCSYEDWTYLSVTPTAGPRQQSEQEALISDAALAVELFGDDELESFAASLAKAP